MKKTGEVLDEKKLSEAAGGHAFLGADLAERVLSSEVNDMADGFVQIIDEKKDILVSKMKNIL
ncbi:MAG: hypothetical protein IJ062_04280 [Firmicutes bacterium]|nr:hypothetical protein [Bacillota bacterium]